MAVTYSQNGVIVRQNTVKQVAYTPPQSSTLIIDKNGYIGDKQQAAGNTYYATVDSVADFSDEQLGQVTLLFPKDDEIAIGGKIYKIIAIGNKIWLAQNLDFNFDGNAVYYNNDESTYGWNGLKYGALYNYSSLQYLVNNGSSLIPVGWRVPTESDFNDLIANASDDGVSVNSAFHLKSTNSWVDNKNGDNSVGFNAFACGNKVDQNYDYLGKGAFFWANNGKMMFMSNESWEAHVYDWSTAKHNSVRLVKDVT